MNIRKGRKTYPLRKLVKPWNAFAGCGDKRNQEPCDRKGTGPPRYQSRRQASGIRREDYSQSSSGHENGLDLWLATQGCEKLRDVEEVPPNGPGVDSTVVPVGK